MVFFGASVDRRLLVLPALVVLLVAAVVFAAPAQAQLVFADVPGQTDHSDLPDADDDPDHDGGWPEPADAIPVPAGPGDSTGGTGVDGIVDALGGSPEWDAPQPDELPRVTSTFVAGTAARLRTDGKAAIPRGAPKRVRTLLSQINSIVGKRYKWGGGHAKLVDKGYDCSGAVSYGLIKTGLLQSSMVSGRFARWGEAGTGRWITIYANKGHVYMEVAGLRLDTSAVGDDPVRKGVRWRPVIGKRASFKVRHPAGL